MKSKSKKRKNFRLTSRLLIEYIVSVVIYLAVETVLIFSASWIIQNLFVWHDDIIYRILYWVRDFWWFWYGLIFLIGWVILTVRLIGKLSGYLNELADAASLLALQTERPLILSPILKSVQDELNGVREQSLNNARLAKEADQRKSELIVYLAHDLKTPLTSVIGYLTLIRDEPDLPPETRARYTGVALEKAYRLEELVNEFFEITRFSLTNLTLEPTKVDLSRMLAQLASEFEPILAQKELVWKTEIAPACTVVCDVGKLERVFDNLIRNAIYYSYRGTTVYLRLEKAYDCVVLKVRNHGKTIPPEKLGRIFEQFFRVDSSRSSDTGGAGLGLAIAKEIVNLHGGVITAASADEIIEFTVKLPYDCKKNVRNL